MKKAVLVLFALLALSCAQAQDSYFGIRGDIHYFPNATPDISAILPLAGIQLGFPVLDNVEVRTSLLSAGFVNFLQVDVLYSENVSDTLRGYGGVGGDLGVDLFSSGWIIGVHATAGLEYHLGSGIGLFGEVQPLYIAQSQSVVFNASESGTGFIGKLNVGINFHL